MFGSLRAGVSSLGGDSAVAASATGRAASRVAHPPMIAGTVSASAEAKDTLTFLGSIGIRPQGSLDHVQQQLGGPDVCAALANKQQDDVQRVDLARVGHEQKTVHQQCAERECGDE